MENKVEVKWEHRRVMIEECVSTIIVPEYITKNQLDSYILEKLKNEKERDVVFDRYEHFYGSNLDEDEIKIIEINEDINVPEPLKIFHICRKEEAGFDEVQEFFIVASNIDEAFLIARRNKGDEILAEWSTYFSIVHELGLYTGNEKEPYVVSKNIKNG